MFEAIKEVIAAFKKSPTKEDLTVKYHIYKDHGDLHLQIDSTYNVVIIEGREEIERLLSKIGEALGKDYEISNKKEG